MRSTPNLGRIFALLVPCSAIVAACGGSSASSDDLGPAACLTNDEVQYGVPTDAKLATGYDALVLMFPVGERIRVGEVCRTATQKAACVAKLQGMAQGNVAVFATKGDNVKRIAGRNEAIPVFLPIDTPGEARVVAATAGGTPTCTGRDVVREGSGSYLVATVSKDSKCTDAQNNGNLQADVLEIRTVVRVSPSGEVTKVSEESTPTGETRTCGPVPGRRPEGLVEYLPGTGGVCGSIGAWLRRAAHLEAASVVAFERMVLDLTALGAAGDIVERARCASEEEARHARAMTTLSNELGIAAEAPRVEVAPRTERTLFAIALENAVEGCVRETFSALISRVQAARSPLRNVRSAMRPIADEEQAHAALSWDLHAWFMVRLDERERQAIEQAMRVAQGELLRACRQEEPEHVRHALGLPTQTESTRLAEGLFDQLSNAA